jgi:hypothetical protein
MMCDGANDRYDRRLSDHVMARLCHKHGARCAFLASQAWLSMLRTPKAMLTYKVSSSSISALDTRYDWGFRAGFILMNVGVPQLLIILTVNPLSVGCSNSVISVNGWHELSEPHSYRGNMYV